MADNRSLDEFLDPSEDPPDETTDEPTATISLTYQSVPDGTQCPECNSTVTRRWSSENGLVCDDCKHW